MIGLTGDKGECRGWGANFQDATCPPSLTGFTWWVYRTDLKGWYVGLEGLAVRCVSNDDQKTTNGPLNFVPTKEVGRSISGITSINGVKPGRHFENHVIETS